jgi:Ca2+-binding RTX toxin-like protein
LTAVTDSGIAVYTVTADPLTAQYQVSMLKALDGTTFSATQFGSLTAGNTPLTYVLSNLNNVFRIDIDGTVAGVKSTVNTNNGYIGIGNNFIDSGELLTMKFNTVMTGVDLKIDALGKGERLSYTAYDSANNVVHSSFIEGTTKGGSTDILASIGDFPAGNFTKLVFETSAGSSTRIGLTGATGETTLVSQTTGLSFTAVDADGDGTAPQALALTFDTDGTLVAGATGGHALAGGSGADMLTGGASADHLVGGGGSDVLTGGLGADVFQWHLSDRGTAGALPTDRITDFNGVSRANGGDVLDLRDLLQGEQQGGGLTAGNLEQYLDFSVVNGSTEIRISSTGQFANGNHVASAEDQRITLQSVDIRSALGLGGGATDTQIIESLLKQDKLVVDAP